jgi:hypothetical protein
MELALSRHSEGLTMTHAAREDGAQRLLESMHEYHEGEEAVISIFQIKSRNASGKFGIAKLTCAYILALDGKKDANSMYRAKSDKIIRIRRI